MGNPDAPHNSATPEAHERRETAAGQPPPPDAETREARLMQHALGALAALPQAAPEGPERVPSVGEQLQLICDVGKMLRMTAPSDKERIAYWEVYKQCINDFRDAYGLPPLEKARTNYKWSIASAMERGDADALIRIFDEEKKEYAKPPFYRRIPGFNFLFGVAGGAGEMGSNLYELGKQGVKAVAGDQQAREMLKRVGKSFLELDKVLATVIRKDEYADSIQKGGEETGYVLGKSAFDLASALLTGGAAGAAGKGLAVGGHAGREAAHIAGHVAGHLGAEAVHVAGHETHGPEEEHAPATRVAKKPKPAAKPEKRV